MSDVDGKCSHAECAAAARYGVVFLLVPGRTYTGHPYRLLTNYIIYEIHKAKTVDAYLTEESWGAVLKYFDERKVARPHRASTRVDYVPIVEAAEGAATGALSN